jgi:hypothetical protein
MLPWLWPGLRIVHALLQPEMQGSLSGMSGPGVPMVRPANKDRRARISRAWRGPRMDSIWRAALTALLLLRRCMPGTPERAVTSPSIVDTTAPGISITWHSPQTAHAFPIPGRFRASWIRRGPFMVSSEEGQERWRCLAAADASSLCVAFIQVCTPVLFPGHQRAQCVKYIQQEERPSLDHFRRDIPETCFRAKDCDARESMRYL